MTTAEQQLILVLQGPNLDRLGVRDPKRFGPQTLAELGAQLERDGAEFGSAVGAAHVQPRVSHASHALNHLDGEPPALI